MKLYLEITQDELALPVKVCLSVQELAEKTGLKRNNVESRISKSNEYKYPRFIKVEVDE